MDSEELSDPIAESVRSILDGHIVLSKQLAARNHFPAIDLLNSTSRVMKDIVGRDHYTAIRSMIELQARYQQSEDLILLGAYKAGTNGNLDKAVRAQDGINAFLRQDIEQSVSIGASVQDLFALMKSIG
jgi:flagellum-specific ATP synthase